MSTLVKHFGSHQGGAPALSGVVGTMIGVLDACLVNGYNTKTIVITRSGTTCTATSSAHGFTKHTLVVITGADQPEYNNEFYIDTVPTADTFTFEVAGSPVTPATGTISCKVQSAGWTKEFTGTNLAVYRAPTGTRHYLRVDDTQATYTRIRGYVSMSDINTGVEPFPTLVQQPIDQYNWIRSNSSGSTARDWRLVANDKMFYLYQAHTGLFGESIYTGNACFGEFDSLNALDTYNTQITAYTSTGGSAQYGLNIQALASTDTQQYLPRKPVTYVEGAVQFGRSCSGSTTYIGNVSSLRSPNVFTGEVEVKPVKLHDGAGNYIGVSPGIYGLMSGYEIYREGLIVEGSGDLTGRVFLSVNGRSSTSLTGICLIEVRGTWGS